MISIPSAGAICAPRMSQARAKSRPRGTWHSPHLLALLGLLTALVFSPAQATVVYDQPHNGTGTIYRSCWSDPDGTPYDEFLWDSFQLASDQAITEIHWRGGHDPAYAYWGGPVIDFRVKIFPNSIANQPDVVGGPLRQYQTGDTCGETLVGTFGGVAMYDYHFTLPAPFQAANGVRYWVQVIANQGWIPDWGFAAGSGGNGSHFRHLTEGPYQSISGDVAFSLHTSSAPTATISAGVEPVGTGSVFGAGVYPIGSNCTLTATAGAGYGFDSWTDNGTVVENNAQYTFAVSADRALVAHFVPSYLITVDRWPSMGGHVGGGGNYNAGASVTVTALPSLGYSFIAWLDGGATPVSTSLNYTFNATANRLLVAQFAQQPLAATFDFDTGTPPCWPGQTMPGAQSHSGLTAFFTARTGFWSIQDDVYYWIPLDFAGNFLYPSNFGSTLTIGFDQPLTDLKLDFCTAEISADYDVASLVRITAYQGSVAGPLVGSASAQGEWISGAYPEGAVSFSSATPFDVVTIDFPYQPNYPISGILFVDNIIAVRAPVPTATLSADAFPPEGGMIYGAGTYPAGTPVTLEAVANDGWVFSHWEENLLPAGTSPILDLVLDADRSLTAVFAPVLAVAYDAQADPAVVTLSWPWPAAGYVLREKEMTTGAVWLDSTLPVQVVGGRNVAQAPVNPDRKVTFLLWHL